MIKIAGRLHPFSHVPKTRCLIPGTEVLVEACPALIRIGGKEVVLEIEGPLKNFTVIQDLERGCVTVFSEHYHFHILPSCEIVYTKNPHLPPLANQERLSLGSHKKQEWEGIRRRLDFREIFPVWFRLGSLLKLPKRQEKDEGIFTLIADCGKAILAHQPEKILPAFRKLFLAGFTDLMVPRLQDEECQGILPFNMPLAKSSPLYLLTEGAELIRSLIFLSSGNELALLPNLPPEFFAGRMVNLACPPYGELDIEWTKKEIRRLEFRAAQEGELHLHFPSSLKHYRVRSSKRERGEKRSCGDPLEIKSGCRYLLDQIRK